MKILVIPDIHLKPWIVRLSVSIMNELIETEQTQPDGKPVGEISDLRFVVVDTIEKTFRYADELVSCISPGQISSFYPQD